MKKKVLLTAGTLFLAVCGFFLPDLASLFSDMKRENTVMEVPDPAVQDQAEETDLLTVLEEYPKMKQRMLLRNGGRMDESEAQRTAGQILEEMESFGITEIPEQTVFTVVPVLAYGEDAGEDARIVWLCSWQQETDIILSGQAELYLDDETGYLLSFAVYSDRDADGETPGRKAERMNAFLNSYYLSGEEGGFSCLEQTEDSVFVYTADPGRAENTRLCFVIMENGQLVFNM